MRAALRRWWLHVSVTLMLVPSGIELLNVYRAIRFGALLMTLRPTVLTACTGSVLGQAMGEARAGQLFLGLGLVSAAALLSGRMLPRFVVSLAGVFVWYVYTSIREHCAPVPADALYEAQVLACAMTAWWTGYWLFSGEAAPILRLLRERSLRDEF